MKFLVMTLISNGPDPVTGRTPTPNARFHRVVDNAVLAEELGFDGYAVGERHERPFFSSAPPVVLPTSRRGRPDPAVHRRHHALAARPGARLRGLRHPRPARRRPPRADHRQGQRRRQAQLFHVTTDDQWDRNAEGYELFRRLWREERTTWAGRFRPSLVDAETWPPPRQQPIRVWHGSATSRDSVELAARYGDPLFSANVTNPVEPYAELVAHYRERWAAHGHDPADALVGAGTAAFHVAATSQQAIEEFRPAFAQRLARSPSGSGCRRVPDGRGLRGALLRARSAARSRSSTRCCATTRRSATR